MTRITDTAIKLTTEEERDFEAWAARRGYNTRKERGRYCHVALNDILAAVVEFKRASARALPVQALEPVYELSVRGVFQDCAPLVGAFGLPDGKHSLYLAATRQKLAP